MGVTTTWLIDKSALVRLAGSPSAAEWATRIQRGLIAISSVTRLEIWLFRPLGGGPRPQPRVATTGCNAG